MSGLKESIWYLHKNLLCRRSDFFEKTFEEGFKEASDRSLRTLMILRLHSACWSIGSMVPNPHLVLPTKRSASTTILISTSLRRSSSFSRLQNTILDKYPT